MEAIEKQSVMDKDVLVRIMHNLLEEDLLGEKRAMDVTDENTLSVAEHGSVTVKNTMASPKRMLRMSSNQGAKGEDNSQPMEISESPSPPPPPDFYLQSRR